VALYTAMTTTVLWTCCRKRGYRRDRKIRHESSAGYWGTGLADGFSGKDFGVVQTESRDASIPSSLLTLAAQVTDCHAAIFDAATALLAAYRAFMKCFATRLL